jgi:hypothetical protein
MNEARRFSSFVPLSSSKNLVAGGEFESGTLKATLPDHLINEITL